MCAFVRTCTHKRLVLVVIDYDNHLAPEIYTLAHTHTYTYARTQSTSWGYPVQRATFFLVSIRRAAKQHNDARVYNTTTRISRPPSNLPD